MAERYNYSIIIPHKNIPELLERCLLSIPRRDDLQIIVVDDNSDPAVVDFDHFPGLNDPAVEVLLTKEGKGAGYARNIGLGKAKGRMVLFADADDFFNYCVYDILDEYQNSDADLVYFKANSVDSAKFTTANRGLLINQLTDQFKHNQDKISLYSAHAVWSRLFKRSLIVNNKIVFSEIPMANDIMFSIYCTFYAQTITVDDRALYCCTVRSGSIRTPVSNSRSAANRLIDLYENWKKIAFLRQHHIHDKYSERWISLVLLDEYFDDRENFKKVEHQILSLGFTKAYIKGVLRSAFVWRYITHPMLRIYYRIRRVIKKPNGDNV